jgi:hypothetical protein
MIQFHRIWIHWPGIYDYCTYALVRLNLHCHLAALPIFLLSQHAVKRFIDFCRVVEFVRMRGWNQQSNNKVIKAHRDIHSLHRSIKDHLKASETISRVTTCHTHTKRLLTCVGSKRLTMALIRKSNKTLRNNGRAISTHNDTGPLFLEVMKAFKVGPTRDLEKVFQR